MNNKENYTEGIILHTLAGSPGLTLQKQMDLLLLSIAWQA